MPRALALLVPSLLCLALFAPATAQSGPLAEPHERIRHLVVDQILGGRTDGIRVVAIPAEILPGDDIAFRWTMGEVVLPQGTAWFALADETPGIMGFHPVTHVFLDRALRVIETRRETFYPRVYIDGVRRGLTTLIEYRALPNPNPPKREPVGSLGKDGPSADFSYSEFYAVIIEGDVPAGASYSEFWSDPVQMFRLLLEFGYAEDNIHVLYGEGHDETTFACEYYREQMVDWAAYKQDVRNIFTWMKDGNAGEGVARVTADDFVFLFTFDHGSGNAACEAQLCLMDGCMPDTEFASYFNQIPYKHRAVDMQQCNSGGFIDNLQNATTVISTAANCSESAYEADEQDDCGGGVWVKYGEWNYWWMSAMRGHKPWPGEQPVDADTDNDGKVSFQEAHNYALANDNRSEHPQWSDLGGIGDELSLVTTWGGVHLAHLSHALDDASGGNGDGIADAGESHVMRVTLENLGEDDALGVSGTLVSESPYATVEDTSALFPDIARQGGVGESLADHFAWRTAAETPDATDVTLRLDWSANGGADVGSTRFFERIVRVILVTQQTAPDDVEGGDGDGTAEAGETLALAVTLRNKGHAEARQVTGRLSSCSAGATILNDQAEFENVPGPGSGRSLAPHYSISLAPDVPDRTWIECTLDVEAADGYAFELPVRFIVGSRGSVLLIDDGDTANADLLAEEISGLGFAVVRETAAETSAETWLGYSALVWAAGSNVDPVAASRRTELESFVTDGGRLLIEGGELGLEHRYNTSFRERVLHMASWVAHGGGGLTVADDDHPLATVPGVLEPLIAISASGNADHDAVTPLVDARTALAWETRPTNASVIAFDDDALEGNGGQIVALFARTSAIDDTGGQRRALLDDALEWLLGNDLPYLVATGLRIDDTVRGNGDGIADPGETVAVAIALGNRGSGEATGTWSRATLDRADIAAFTDNYAAWPGIGSGISAESLLPHTMIRIADDAACGTPIELTLELRTNEGFRATRALSFKIGTGGGMHATYAWPSEAQQIPNPGVLDAPITIPDGFVVGDVNCHVDASHSSITLIKIILESPLGTRVTLHDRTGTGSQLNATYDTNRQPDGPGSMSDFDGEVGTGTWHLYVNDMKTDMMVGALNAWSLIFDTADLCHGSTCTDAIPAAVGPSLELEKLEGGDVRFSWESVPGADGYVVWRSRDPRLLDAESASRTAGPQTSCEEHGLPQDGEMYFYVVRAENECGDEGP